MDCKCPFLPLIALVLVAALPCRAVTPLLTVTAQSVSATPGSIGNTLEVTLSNSGLFSAVVSGFGFEISTATPNINFTSATTSTVGTYIFAGNSVSGPTISTTTGQTLDASDVYGVTHSGVSIGPGQTVSLGHVTFDVAPGASGPVTVVITAFPSTSLSDPFGNNVPIANLANGLITLPSAPQAPATGTADVPSQVRYAANLAFGESYIDIANDGANGAPLLGPGFGTPTGNLCVNLFFVDPNEELISCCSCTITANQTAELGVAGSLTNNGKGTLTGALPSSVTIFLLGEAGTCPSNAAASLTAPIGGFVAFGTTLHQTSQAGTFATTEAPFASTTLSASELASLTGRCAGIIGNDSSYGLCAGCSAGALGAFKK
jgi:hypothetical protein